MINVRLAVGQLLAATVLTKITDDGPWIGNDWTLPAAQIKVVDGVPMGMNGDA